MSTLSSAPPNVTPMPQDPGVFPAKYETATRPLITICQFPSHLGDLEVAKASPREPSVEVKAVFEKRSTKYSSKEGKPTQGSQIFTWDDLNLLWGFKKIFQEMEVAHSWEIGGLRSREKTRVEVVSK
ncbi:hypothetical protein DSO57_1003623 [Entomophthora muscae]|uniref:Uncharacterized protein n=1 Tax=Entomophthora muscae TaxID=34485 RepID=A0ACC2SL13_9FUNG|nr:hypothetical protein DSO57_1003623 [Entomophthora muscae]